jgi:ATP-dependent RNA helicase DeaD
MKFSDMNLEPELLEALYEMGIQEPTEIQEAAIPKILNNPEEHILAQAKTGTGKTLAFSIPLAQTIDPKLKKVQAVILVPTRELCKQVYDVFTALTKHKRIQAVEVYGGVSIERQVALIMDGAQVIIATPGRLIDIYQRNQVSFSHVNYVVLDEADRMLDMGFYPDMEFLLLTAMRQARPRLFLFSATLVQAIKELAANFNQGGTTIEIDVSHDELTVDNCHQYYYLIDDYNDKYYHFVRILRHHKPEHSMIFVNTKRTGEWLFNRLMDERDLNLKIELIQGDLSQHKREQVLNKFRNQQINCLIATDVAARGLDIPEITHVFNYDIPEFEDNYVHRIGRTSRMERPGKAISLCLADQYNLLCRIEGYTKKGMEKLPLPPRTGKNEGQKQPSHHRETPQFHDRRSQQSNHRPEKRSGPPRNSRPPRGPNPQNRSRSNQDREKDKKQPDRRSFLY